MFASRTQMREPIQAIAGSGSWRGGVLVIADEHEIEEALVKTAAAFEAMKRAGYTPDQVHATIPVPGRCSMLPIEETPFNRALHRFALVNIANLALAIRFTNAAFRRDRPDAVHRAEWAAAQAALQPRLDAFHRCARGAA